MSVFRTGKASGTYAQKYPDFCYQKTTKKKVKSVPLLDFTVDFTEMSPTGKLKIAVWFEPNEHTVARARKQIVVVMAANVVEHYDGFTDMLLSSVFNYPYITPYIIRAGVIEAE